MEAEKVCQACNNTMEQDMNKIYDEAGTDRQKVEFGTCNDCGGVFCDYCLITATTKNGKTTKFPAVCYECLKARE